MIGDKTHKLYKNRNILINIFLTLLWDVWWLVINFFWEFGQFSNQNMCLHCDSIHCPLSVVKILWSWDLIESESLQIKWHTSIYVDYDLKNESPTSRKIIYYSKVAFRNDRIVSQVIHNGIPVLYQLQRWVLSLLFIFVLFLLNVVLHN